ALHHLTGDARRPARAVGEDLHGEQRLAEVAAGVLEGPGRAAVLGAGDLAVETDRHALVRVDAVNAKERRQIERVDDLAAEQRLLLLRPGLAAVGRLEDLAELTDDPAGVRIDELHVVERRLLRDHGGVVETGEQLVGDVLLLRRLVLRHLPRRAAVRRLHDGRLVADRDQVLRRQREGAEQVRLRAGIHRLPRLAAVGRLEDRAALPDRPAVRLVRHGDLVDRLVG